MVLTIKSLAQDLNLEIDRGGTWRYEIFLLDPVETIGEGTEDDLEAVSPLNVEGWSFYADFKRSRNQPESVLSLTSENGGLEVLNASEGRLQVLIEHSQTSLMVGEGVYDLLGISPEGDRRYLLKGTWLVNPTVTRTD